jgi:lipoprotein-releasing system permease protein
VRTIGVSDARGDARLSHYGPVIGVIANVTGFVVGTVFCANVEKLRPFPSCSPAPIPPELHFLSRLPAEIKAAVVCWH